MSGLDAESPAGLRWLGLHDQCVAWASLNRNLIAEKAASALGADCRLAADVPHNLVRRTGDGPGREVARDPELYRAGDR